VAVEHAENSELITVLHRIDLTLQIPAEVLALFTTTTITIYGCYTDSLH